MERLHLHATEFAPQTISTSHTANFAGTCTLDPGLKKHVESQLSGTPTFDWVDRLGRDWGRYMLNAPNGWNRRNWLQSRLEEFLEGTGCSYKRSNTSSDNSSYSLAGIDKKVGQKFGHVNDGFKYSGIRAQESSGVNMLRSYSHGDHRMTVTFGMSPTVTRPEKNNYRYYRQKIPIRGMSQDQLSFHRAWKELPYCHQAMLWTHYVPDVGHKRKVALLQTTSAQYWKWLDFSLWAAAREIQHLDMLPAKKISIIRQKSKVVSKPLWPCRIFSYVHKVPIHATDKSLLPTIILEDPFVYCRRPSGELYAAVLQDAWPHLRKRRKLAGFLDGERNKSLCDGTTDGFCYRSFDLLSRPRIKACRIEVAR